jgi:hypothetical protein
MFYLTSARPEMVNLARIQGGRQIQTGGILFIFRGLEFVAQRRNRMIGAVSGWALTKKSGSLFNTVSDGHQGRFRALSYSYTYSAKRSSYSTRFSIRQIKIATHESWKLLTERVLIEYENEYEQGAAEISGVSGRVEIRRPAPLLNAQTQFPKEQDPDLP